MTPGPASTGLALAAVALAAGGLLWFGGTRAPVEATGPVLLPEGPAPVVTDPAPDLRLPVGPEPTAPTAATPITGAAFLDDHYGLDAPAVRALLEARGVDPEDLPLPLPEEELLAALPLWLVLSPEERAEQRRVKAAWPEALSNAWLVNRYHVLVDLGPDQLAAVDDLAALHAPVIAAEVDRYLDELEAAMLAEFVQGGVQTSPFVAWPPPEAGVDPLGAADPDPAFYTLVRVGGAWVVRVGLTQGHHPAAAAALAAVGQAVQTRDDHVREALLALQ